MKILATIAFLIITCACSNSDNQKLVGKYKVAEYTLADSTKPSMIPTLLLKDNDSFIVTYDTWQIAGTWHREENQDLDFVQFRWGEDGIYRTKDAFVSGNNFEFVDVDHTNTFLPGYYKVSFKRISR